MAYTDAAPGKDGKHRRQCRRPRCRAGWWTGRSRVKPGDRADRWCRARLSCRFCVTPWVTVALVVPFNVTDIDLGGQVVKYPADDPEPATDAVMTVVPGCAAVITLVALFSVATEEVPTE